MVVPVRSTRKLNSRVRSRRAPERREKSCNGRESGEIEKGHVCTSEAEQSSSSCSSLFSSSSSGDEDRAPVVVNDAKGYWVQRQGVSARCCVVVTGRGLK
jgi:hypothetical protein